MALVPRYVFPICEAGQLSPFGSYDPAMRCYWFAKAEFLLAALVIVTGSVMILRPVAGVRFACGILLGALGVGVILVSLNAFIGSTCFPSHPCQIGTKPAARLLGGVIAAAGLLSLLLSARKASEPQ